MQKVTKKVLSVVFVLVMAFLILAQPIDAAETNTSKTVTITVEKLTIGQGYLVEPMQVEIKDGDTVATVFEKAMTLKGITYPNVNGDYGFYLNYIHNADTGIIDIPTEIATMPKVTLWNGDITKAPTNTENEGNPYENGGLGDGSYNTMAGWQYALNNANTNVGADQALVKDGDVIRWQFSVYGYGADIGFDTESFTGIPAITLANKDALIQSVAVINEDSEMSKNTTIKARKDSAIAVLTKYNATQGEVDDEIAKLKEAIESYKKLQMEATTKQEVETTVQIKEKPEVTKIVLKRVSIASVKNVKKYKVKIKIKKMILATGYQYRYATNKQMKKAVVKTTTKTTFTTKKLKKKQRCYVMVRAYVNVNGTRQYGLWSKKKSVKIKKWSL